MSFERRARVGNGTVFAIRRIEGRVNLEEQLDPATTSRKLY